MKSFLQYFLILFSAFLYSENVLSEDTVVNIGNDSIVDVQTSKSLEGFCHADLLEMESQPIFPGGIDSLTSKLERTFDYRIINYGQKPRKIRVEFQIDKQGSVGQICINECSDLSINKYTILHDNAINKEITRVLMMLPKWEPAKLGGKNTPTRFRIPITIPYTDFRSKYLKIDSTICQNVDQLADFRFGQKKLLIDRIYDYSRQSIKWPMDADCEGVVFYQCVVDKDGRLTNFKLIRGINKEFDIEALRVITNMPNWIPATKDNKVVKSIIVIPICFKIER